MACLMLPYGLVFIPVAASTQYAMVAVRITPVKSTSGEARRRTADMMRCGGASAPGSCGGIRCATTAAMGRTKSTTSKKLRSFQSYG